jgi:hypothetical protein
MEKYYEGLRKVFKCNDPMKALATSALSPQKDKSI